MGSWKAICVPGINTRSRPMILGEADFCRSHDDLEIFIKTKLAHVSSLKIKVMLSRVILSSCPVRSQASYSSQCYILQSNDKVKATVVEQDLLEVKEVGAWYTTVAADVCLVFRRCSEYVTQGGDGMFSFISLTVGVINW